MNYDDFLNLVRQRRSIRRFKPDPVPDEYINKIIDAARLAPSSMNQQPWEFVVVRDLELRKKILEYCFEYARFAQKMNNAGEPQSSPAPLATGGQISPNIAPVFILLFGDTRTMKAEPRDLQCHQLTIQDIFTSNLASAYMYMHLAATALGLASAWNSISRTPYPQCMIKTLLGIPGELQLHDVMMLGYPGGEPGTKPMREGKMVHYDRCGADDFRTDEEVLEFTRRSRIKFAL